VFELDLKPSAIVAALDQYVIGQDDAKRIVAVAV
jgi:ATP-dependent protease HslVU (ClpYQ) ATPase subunit